MNEMNKETLVEAYKDRDREVVKLQNACQDVLFILDEALSGFPPNSAGDYLRQIAARLERVI